MYSTKIPMISHRALTRSLQIVRKKRTSNTLFQALIRFHSSEIFTNGSNVSPVSSLNNIETLQSKHTKSNNANADVSDSEVLEEAEESKIDLESVGVATSQTLTIADVLASQESQTMKLQWQSIACEKTVQDAVSIMVANNLGALIVTHDSKGVAGIITERDIMNKTSPRSYFEKKHLVKDVMSPNIMCIPTNTTIIDALACMIKEKFRHLSVISESSSSQKNKNEVVPIEAVRCVLSVKDIVRAYAQMESNKKDRSRNELATQTSQTNVSMDKLSAQDSAEGANQENPKVSKSSSKNASESATEKITASTLLKKKHKTIKLILNTRVEDNISVAEAVEAMVRQDFGSVLIVDKELTVRGIFTEHDYLSKVLSKKKDPSETLVTEVCTHQVLCLHLEDSLEDCWNIAVSKPFRHFPVVTSMRKDRKEPELAGILSIKDIVREVSKGRQTPKTFWFIDFFKSKMENKSNEKPPPFNVTTSNSSDPKSEALKRSEKKQNSNTNESNGRNSVEAIHF